MQVLVANIGPPNTENIFVKPELIRFTTDEKSDTRMWSDVIRISQQGRKTDVSLMKLVRAYGGFGNWTHWNQIQYLVPVSPWCVGQIRKIVYMLRYT